MAKKEYFTYKQGSVNGEILMNSQVFSMIAFSTLSDIDGIVIENHKDISCNIEENCISFEVSVNVKYGKKVTQLTQEAQKKVSDAIKQYTGVDVGYININVNNIEFD